MTLCVSPEDTYCGINMEDDNNETFLGMISDVPVSIDGRVTLIYFLVFDMAPVDVIVGYPPLKFSSGKVGRWQPVRINIV